MVYSSVPHHLLGLLPPPANALALAWSQVGLCVRLRLGSGIRKRQSKKAK